MVETSGEVTRLLGEISRGNEAAMSELAGSLEMELDRDRVALDGHDVSAAIREPRVSDASSRASVHPAVREAMRE